jgi:site-specific recombinase XerC
MPSEQPTLVDLPPAPPRPASASPARPPALDPATPLEAAIQGWLDHLARMDTSRHTLIAFRSDLNLLLEYLDSSAPVNTIGTATLNQFLAWMKDERGKPCSDKTYGRRVTSLKAFFRWVAPLAELRADPAETIVQLNVRSPLPEVLTEEEIARCLAAGERLRLAEEKPDLRPLVLFDLLLQTGMKKVEVANLKLEHIDAASAAKPYLYVRYPEKKDWPKERRLDLTRQWIDGSISTASTGPRSTPGRPSSPGRCASSNTRSAIPAGRPGWKRMSLST